ncbi:MAG: serine/threonine protein kinase [Myxococcales bacterium]|nr:serine/threonine protein kinase [Myxococcales bacterium]
MAEVFKAKSFGVEGFEKILAIKRILPSMAEDADFIEMFIDEAKICGQLNHANICQIFELGRVEDSHFIAMEYVWGKDVLQLQNRFRKLRATMKPEMAAFIAAKLCEGLDYAHKKKDAAGRPLHIIHRDISPQNILISYDGELKIIDFGIAKAASRSSKTQAGVLKGKFGYMSPEQVRGLPLDRRSDVFAIGTILYELLTSDRLFMGESDFETLEKVRNVDVPPISSINKTVPPELERIINKALARDVDERFQWANEMQDSLQAFLLSREPVFTSKQLSSWMREQFVLEMKREQQILDEQRKIGKEILNTRPAPRKSDSMSPSEEFGGSTNVLEGTELADLVLAAELSSEPSDPSDEDGAEKTTVQQPSFGAPAAASPLPEQSTQILADNLLAKTTPPKPTAGETTGRAATATELPAQPTVILDGGTGATQLPSAGMYSSPQAQTLLAQPAPVLPAGYNGQAANVILSDGLGGRMTPTGGSGVRSPSTGNVVSPPPYAHGPAGSTLWKDIAIGVGVAVAVVAAVLGARAIWTRGSKGTLVVMVNAAKAADVFVDGAIRGHIEPGSPLTLREIPAGSHNVSVKTADGLEFKQQVALLANDVSVLTAVPRAASTAAPGTGHLKLNITTDGAQVWVDGAQLADGAWKAPIPLRADVAHDIRVTKPLREEVKLAVTLRAGEAVMRDVDLLPAYGKIAVASEPAGAEVSVNGKRSGVTPLTISDIDPGKPARVTVRLKSYAAVTKYVAFEKGLEQALDLKLVTESEALAAGESKSRSRSKDKDKDEDLASVKVASSSKTMPAGVASQESGYLVANTQPWAKVIIDGKDTGKTTPIAPRSKIALKPGKHVVTFVANGKKFNFDVVIKAAEDTRLIKQLADMPQ